MKRLVIGPSKQVAQEPRTLRAVAAEVVTAPTIVETIIEKTVETQHHHTTVLVPSRDKRARLHSLMSAKRNARQLDEMCESLNEQNEIARATRRGIHSMVQQMDAMKAELAILKAQKPVELHTVTKEIVLTPQPQNKLIIAGVILSIVLSILSLVK